MANVKITALNSQSASLLADEDLFVVVDLSENETKRINLRTIKEVATDPISSNVANLQVGLDGTNANVYATYTFFQANVEQIANSIAYKSNLTNNSYELQLQADGNVSFPTGNVVAGNGYISLSNLSGNNYARINSSNIELSVNSNTWAYQSNGTLSLPFGGSIGDAYLENAPSLIGSANLYSEIVSYDKKAAVWVEDYSYEGQAGGGGVGIGINLDPTTGSIYGYDSHVWSFTKQGVLRLPLGTIIDDTSNAFILTPPSAANGQSLVISAMTGDNKHVHITTEDSVNTALYLGYDSHYIKIDKGLGNVVIGTTNDYTYGSLAGSAGPNSSIIVSGTVSNLDLIVSIGDTISFAAGPSTTVTGTVVLDGDWIIPTDPAVFESLQLAYPFSFSGVKTEWVFSPDGKLTLPGGAIFDDRNYSGAVLQAPIGKSIELSTGNTGVVADTNTAVIYTNAGNYTFDENATLTLPGSGQPSQITFSESEGAYISQGMGQLVAHTGDGSSFVIETGNANASWEFSSNGVLNLTNGPYIIPGYPQSGAEYIPGMVTIVGEQVYIANTNGDAYVGAGSYGAEIGTANTYVAATHTEVTLASFPSYWSFKPDGTTTFPANKIKQPVNTDLSIETRSYGDIVFNRGDSSHLTTNDPIDFSYNSWTIESWVYLRDDGNNILTGVGITPGPNIYFAGTAFIVQSGYGALNVWSDVTPTLNTWHHIAVSFNGEGINAWLDGVALTGGQQTTTAESGYGNGILSIGAMPWSDIYGSDMRLTNFRVIVGSVLYDPNSSNITVPTAQLTAITDTKLLLLANSEITAYTDTSGINSITNSDAIWQNSSVAPPITVPSKDWTFDTDGTLTFPEGTTFGTPEGPGTVGFVANANTEFLIETSNGTYSAWSFRADGTTIFPNLQVDLHNGGTQYGQVLKFGDTSSQAIITGPTPPEGASAQRLIIQGQRATGGGEGGDVYLWAGDADTNGGDIKIYAGDADNVSTGSGGYINIDAGSGYTQGGSLNLTAGGSTENGGSVNIIAGSAANGTHGAVNIYTTNGSWIFNSNGDLVLPDGGIITEGTTNIELIPIGGSNASQKVVIYPTVGEGNHIHITSGNQSVTDLYLGNDDQYFKVGANGNNTIGTGANTWIFDNIGLLTFPYSNLTIGYQSGGEYVSAAQNTVLGVASQGPLGSTSLDWVEDYSDYANSSISLIYANSPFASYGSTQILVGNNATNVYSWSFSPDGTTIFPTLTVNLHNGGDQSAQVLKFGDPNKQVIITGPTPVDNAAAQRLIVQGQRGTGTGEGGDVYLWAGDSDVNGGDIKIYAGDADNVSTGVGGYINIDAGNGYNQGGTLTLTAGSSNEYGGTVYIAAGSASNAYTGTNGYIRLSAAAGNWDFKSDGNILLPPSGSIAPISGYMTLGQGLLVGADGSLLNANGNTWALYGDLSDAASFIILPNNDDATANVPLSITNYGSNVEITSNGTWIFGSDGSTTFPNNTIQTNDALSVRVPKGVPSGITAITGSSGMWESNPLTDLATTGGSGTGLTVNVSYDGGYASSIVIANAGSGYTNGDAITVTSGTSSATFTISVIGINSWSFGTDGSLTLPTGGAITEGIATATNNTTVSTIELIPNGSNTSQKIIIYPTAAEGNHIHITSGDQSVTDLYLGNDDQYFRVNANGNNTISTGGNNIWNFDTDGTIYLPDNGSLKTSNGDLNIESITGYVNITSIGSTFTFDNHIGRFIMPAGGTITGAEGSNVVIEGPGGNVTFTSEGVVTIPGIIQGAEGANVTINTPVGNYIFASSGAFSLPGANVNLGTIPSGGEGISGSSNVSLTFLATGATGSSSIEWYDNTEDTANSTTARVVANGYVEITTGNNAANTYSWIFDPVGHIAFPNGDIQGNAFTQSYVTNTRIGLEGANAAIAAITNSPITFLNDVSIRGNFFLTGNSTLITSQTINFGDSLLSLGANNTINDLMDIGFYGHFYDTAANANSHTGLIRSAVNKDWMLFSNYIIDLEGNSYVDISNGSFALGNLRVARVNATSVYSNGVELRSNDYATLLAARSNDYASYVILNSSISNLQIGLEGANTLISSASSDLSTNVTALQVGLAGSNTAISGLVVGLSGSNTAITNLRVGLTGANTAIENLQVGLSGSNGNISTNTTDILNLQSGLAGSNAVISNITVGISGSNTAISDLVTGLTGSNTIISGHTTNITILTGNIANLQVGLSGTNAILNSSNTANVITGLVGANTAITNLQAGLTGANTSIANVRAGLLGANIAIAAITTNNIVFQRDVTVQGNLFLTGNSTALSTSTVVTGDTFLALANNNRSSDVVDVGLYSNFYDGSANNHTGLFRSAISKDWFLFRTYEGSITTNSTIDLSSTTFSLANLRLATANVSRLVVNGTDIITALTDNVNSLRSNDYATYQMIVGGINAANTNISNVAYGLIGANSDISNLQVGISGSNTLITNLIVGLTGANATMASGASTANIVAGLNGANTKILNLQSGLSGSNTKILNLQSGLSGSNTKIVNLQSGLSGSNTAILNLQVGLTQTNVLVNTNATSITNLQTGLLGSNTNIVNITSGLTGANTKILNLQTGLSGANAAIAAITGSSIIFDHDVTVQGNLFLSGNSYVINANTISYGDNFLSIGANNTIADTVDMGLYANFYDGAANSHTGLFRSAVSKDWFLFRSYTKDDPTTLLDIGHGSFSLANLRLATANVSKLLISGTDIITTLTDNVNSLRSNDYSTYITLSSGISGANTSILNLQGGLVGANATIVNLQVGLSGSNTSIDNLQAGLVGSNATISSLSADITNLQTGLTEGANASISNLTVGLAGANTAIANLQGGLTGSNTTINSHTTSINNLVTGLTGSNSIISGHTANITMLVGNIANLQVGLSGANSLISSITVNYDNVVAGLNSANTNISNLQSNVASVRESIIGGLTGSNTNITILTGNIANLQVGLSGANTLINTVQNSLIAYANYANSTFGTASGNVNAVQSNLTAYALYANSTFSGGGGVNQGASYSWTNVHTFSNTIIINAVSANGSLGTAGQVLTSTGSDTYWANSTGTANITLTNATTQSFTASGTQNTFTLTTTIANQNNIIVTLNGLLQVPTTHYTISGTTLLFTDKPYANSLLEVRSLEGGIGLTGGPNNTGNVPQNAQSSSYTLANTDTGKHISITTGGVTVPNTTFAIGDSVVIYNNSGSSQTITQGVNVTMRFVGTATTGNRTLAQYGLATILCVAANTFVSMGGGLT